MSLGPPVVDAVAERLGAGTLSGHDHVDRVHDDRDDIANAGQRGNPSPRGVVELARCTGRWVVAIERTRIRFRGVDTDAGERPAPTHVVEHPAAWPRYLR